jgi:hypothetical protein
LPPGSQVYVVFHVLPVVSLQGKLKVVPMVVLEGLYVNFIAEDNYGLKGERMSAMQSMLIVTIRNDVVAKEEKKIKEEGCSDMWGQTSERERNTEEVVGIEGRVEDIVQIEIGRV